ncbi:hypothetical protein chiPu_0017023 [Chiloscyllium punctatum]|uniref:Natural cytotoxicity triggering receptor 3 n=1 Tax=Chiloscyllium punctatum TaxID=137246 RepID=A0A401T790_CHIPU|nr:hypothetical protein [Chiloscyllium punctatum]
MRSMPFIRSSMIAIRLLFVLHDCWRSFPPPWNSAMNFSHFTGNIWIMTMITAAAVGNTTVIQSPEILSKEPGEAARLGCWYQGPSAIGGYTWYRGIAQGREVSNNTPEFQGRVAAASQEDFRERRDASIRIIDLKVEDTGFYICKIVLVGVGEAYGTGTTVVVTSK